MNERIAFIGGGNMASAIIGGLIAQGKSIDHIDVVEPFAEARDKLLSSFGITAHPVAGTFLANADLLVWAVKPQTFKEAAAAVRAHNQNGLHLSVAAGISSDSIARWLGTERVVRAMPNTPALIGKGITGLFARAAVTESDKALVNQVVATTGEFLWLDAEAQLDAVTALSGSGPAYMFYFMEAMTTAGVEMGLPKDTAYRLAVATFMGAGELAHRIRRGARGPAGSASPPRAAPRMQPCRPWSKTTSRPSLFAPCTPPGSAPKRWAKSLVQTET